MSNISWNIDSLNMHPPGLHHGFICGQLPEAEPLLKNEQKQVLS